MRVQVKHSQSLTCQFYYLLFSLTLHVDSEYTYGLRAVNLCIIAYFLEIIVSKIFAHIDEV